MSEREFAIHFGGRTAGGFGPEERDSEADRARWLVSGNLEVNCLVCHDASAAYDQAEYSNQVAHENFRWAPAAASGLGLVTGSAKQMPSHFRLSAAQLGGRFAPAAGSQSGIRAREFSAER